MTNTVKAACLTVALGMMILPAAAQRTRPSPGPAAGPMPNAGATRNVWTSPNQFPQATRVPINKTPAPTASGSGGGTSPGSAVIKSTDHIEQDPLAPTKTPAGAASGSNHVELDPLAPNNTKREVGPPTPRTPVEAAGSGNHVELDPLAPNNTPGEATGSNNHVELDPLAPNNMKREVGPPTPRTPVEAASPQ